MHLSPRPAMAISQDLRLSLRRMLSRRRMAAGLCAPRGIRLSVDRVAKFISAVTWFWKGVKLDEVEANGQRCMLISRDGTAVVLVVVHASQKGINQIWWMMRPSKLTAIAPSLSRLRTQTAKTATS